MLYDVAVIGRGPAGALASLVLARAGLSVVGIGPSATPGRGDLRAETLSPAAMSILAQHGLASAVEGLKFPVVRGFLGDWAENKQRFRPAFLTPDAPTLAIERGTFDHVLQTSATEAGAVNVPVRARQLQRFADQWKIVLNSQESISARVVIDASGRGGKFLRQVGGKLLVLDSMVAVTELSPTCATNENRIVRITPDADGWLFETVDGVGRHVRNRYTDVDLYKKGVKVRDYARVWAAGSLVMDRAVHGTAIAIGDAAQTRDPLSSQGICSALADAHSAVFALMFWLKGDSWAMRGHERQRRINEIDYLRIRNRFYRAENRWSSSEFWRRRQSLDPLRPLASLWAQQDIDKIT